MSQSAAIRIRLRQARNGLSDDEQQSASLALSRLLNSAHQFGDALNAAFYLPFDGEINPLPLLQTWFDQGRQTLLPVVQSSGLLTFHVYAPGKTMLKPNRYGIDEPAGSLEVALAEIDVVFLPLVGFDRQGNRLGMGKGYYDKTLAPLNGRSGGPLLVGLAHQCQEVSLIPDPWDVPVNFIATDEQLILCQIPRT